MEEELNTPKDIFIDLDSLMDTRLPVIYQIDENLAEEELGSGKYQNRIIDEFGYISKKMFQSLYRDRNKTILGLATPTNMLKLLSDYYKELKSSNVKHGYTDTVNIYLNIYPYDLNIVETTHLANAITATLDDDIVVKIVKMSPTELTPMWVDENLAAMVLYNGMEWVEIHTANLNLINNPLLDVGLMVPALIMTKKNMLKTNEDLDGFFDSIESSMESLIKLKMLPAKDFSIAINR